MSSIPAFHLALFEPNDSTLDVVASLCENYDLAKKFNNTHGTWEMRVLNPYHYDNATVVIETIDDSETAVLTLEDNLIVFNDSGCECSIKSRFCPHMAAAANAEYLFQDTIDTKTPPSPCCSECGYTAITKVHEEDNYRSCANCNNQRSSGPPSK